MRISTVNSDAHPLFHSSRGFIYTSQLFIMFTAGAIYTGGTDEKGDLGDKP